MYENASTTDIRQAAYENQLLDDYERVERDYRMQTEDEALAMRITHQSGPAVRLTEPTKRPSSNDPVDNPIHYNVGDIECIDAIKASMTAVEYRGYLKGNTEKYLWRYTYKNGLEDLKKASWYLNRLIDSMETE